jgi:hypothetical protein
MTLLDKIQSKLADQEKAKVEANQRIEGLKAEWQKRVDGAIALLKEIGVSEATAPNFVAGGSSVSILFKVGEVPGVLTLVGTELISATIGSKLVAQFQSSECGHNLPVISAEELSEALATAIVAYQAEQNIEIVAAPNTAKRRRNGSSE